MLKYRNLEEVLANEAVVANAYHASHGNLEVCLVALASAYRQLRRSAERLAQQSAVPGPPPEPQPATETPPADPPQVSLSRFGLSPERCGECHPCKVVQHQAYLAMPNPPFSHASEHTVQLWNDVLRNYPCLAPRTTVARQPAASATQEP